jgi:hypothetical protein
MVSVILVNILNWNPEKLVVSLIVVFIIQTIDGNIINPKFLSNAIQIHPLLVIASLIIGGKIGGFVGMILAVPCGALVKLYFEKMIHYLHDKRQIEGPNPSIPAGPPCFICSTRRKRLLKEGKPKQPKVSAIIDLNNCSNKVYLLLHQHKMHSAVTLFFSLG